MHYTYQQIATLTGARIVGEGRGAIDWLLTDSRSLAFPETTLFFAIRTARGDGHRYVADLYRRGVRGFVVEELPPQHNEIYPDANFLVSRDTLGTLQLLARRHREQFDIPVVGITGSNGKTVVKEWLYQLLSPDMRVTRSPRSYNSQVGVPLSVTLLDAETRLGLFEAGISQPGEMDALRAMIQPGIGIMTNLGEAHQENFASPEEKCLEKLKLFRQSDVLIFNGDDALIGRCADRAGLAGARIAWSRRDASAALYVSAVEQGEASTTVRYTYLGTPGSYCLPFTDEASVENSIHCLAACLYLNVAPGEIARRMAALEPVAMRLEVKQGVRGCILINDSYNSDVRSLDIALDFMNRRSAHAGRRRTLVLSDILQTGMADAELYARVAEMVNRRRPDRFVGVGPGLAAAADLFEMEARFFPDTATLLASGLLDGLHDEVVLLKGARPFGFEALTERLAQKVHETTLEVNLSAVADNLNHYRSFLKPGVKMVCMVKASAYGAGATEIAKTLQDRGVDYLAVAVADEGADLRAAGVTASIIVMNPEESAAATLFKHRLEPEVYSFRMLETLIHAAEKEGVTGFPVHIKLDTGMHRLGFDPEHDMPALIDRLRRQTALVPRSVFSHFAGSDSAEFDAFSTRQFELFDRASRELQAAFAHKILRHICNTAGIERFPERHLDMVRLGLGLYGIDPIDNRVLHNVATLKTTILQIRDVAADETVGYSRRGKLCRPSRIAAIPIGYADGLNRHLGCGRGHCLVAGREAPYVGNICMDVCMIDVTDIPCHEGDAVEIFGDRLPVTVLAEQLDTIPYEILTSVSNRVKRVYFQD